MGKTNKRGFISGKIKRGQVAIWVILAVALLASIVLFFAISNRQDVKIVTPPTSELIEFQQIVEKCVGENVNIITEIMLPQGGMVAPRNFVRYNNSDVEFLCENINYYERCVMQHPMLIEEMETQIRDNIFYKINDCFSDAENEIRGRGGDIKTGNFDFSDVDIDLRPDRIFVNITREIEITKRGETKTYGHFGISVMNPTYNLARIAVEIANQEAKNCYFETVGYSVTYPRYNVFRYKMSEPIKIYTITDKKSGKEMKIAIRSCAIPPGGLYG